MAGLKVVVFKAATSFTGKNIVGTIAGGWGDRLQERTDFGVSGEVAFFAVFGALLLFGSVRRGNLEANHPHIRCDVFPFEGAGFFGATASPEAQLDPRGIVGVGFRKPLDDGVSFGGGEGAVCVGVGDAGKVAVLPGEGAGWVEVGVKRPFTAGIELLNDFTGVFVGIVGGHPVPNLDRGSEVMREFCL